MKTNGRLVLFLLMIFAAMNAEAGKSLDPTLKLMRQKCTTCHVLPKIGKKSYDELKEKLERHSNRVTLTPEQRDALIQYLKTKP